MNHKAPNFKCPVRSKDMRGGGTQGWQPNVADDNGSQVHLKCNDLTLSSQLIPPPAGEQRVSASTRLAGLRRPPR